MTIFGHRAFKEVIRLSELFRVGPKPMGLAYLGEEIRTQRDMEGKSSENIRNIPPSINQGEKPQKTPTVPTLIWASSSRTVRQDISVLEAIQEVVPSHGSKQINIKIPEESFYFLNT